MICKRKYFFKHFENFYLRNYLRHHLF